MNLKTQKIALINSLLNLYSATNNETTNKYYHDSIYFCIGLTSGEATSCHEIAERLYLKGKKSYES
tara:strand:- start:441 stop:638 length:198 start_codon:yes stop_codon:yes gene_type:complete